MRTLLDRNGNLIEDGKALTSVVPEKSSRIVTYCFGYGKDGDFADAAVSLGYTDVYRYEWGTNDWSAHGDYFVIEYDEFKKWHEANFPFGEGKGYLLDVLPVEWYSGDDLAHPGGHIPGAANVPIVEEWADSQARVLDGGKAFTDVAGDKSITTVIYCGNWSCGKSLIGAKAAVAMGYKKVFRYQGGWEEWKEKGNDLKPGMEP